MVKLSIITPYYQTLELTKRLASQLEPQLTDEVEWIVIDDGCNEKELDGLKAKVIHLDKPSGNASKPRNTGLDNAKGEYISFIDSDDQIKPNYVAEILKKINSSEFDYCLFSWESTGYLKRQVVITDNPPTWNTCVWNCIYKRELIGDTRFNPKRNIGEDEEFNKSVRHGKKENIEDILYIYTSGRSDGLTMRYSRKEISIEKTSEITTSLLLYQKYISKIGGVEKFIQEFVEEFKDIYDMILVYSDSDPVQLKKLSKKIRCIKFNNQKFICDKYLCVSNQFNIADNVKSLDNFYADMIHADYSAMGWKYKKHPKTNVHIAVSEVAKESFEKQCDEECHVIYNLLKVDKPKRVLKLISATRLGLANKEKGFDIMEEIANRLNAKGIPFYYYIFTDHPQKAINGIMYHETVLDIDDYIADADFYISTSKTESWGYSTAQAFELGVPVISTDYPAIYEQGMVEGVNGYVIKRDLSNLDEIIDKMVENNLKGFKYKKMDNPEQWKKLLGDLKKPNYEWREIEMLYKVRTNPAFSGGYWADTTVFDENGDMVQRTPVSEWTIDEDRKEFLESKNAIIVIEEIAVQKKAEPKVEEVKEIVEQKKVVKKTTKKSK